MKFIQQDIQNYLDGWYITQWHIGQKRRIKYHGPYKLKDEAKRDMEILNNKSDLKIELCSK